MESSEDQATTGSCNCDYPMAHCKEHDPTPWTRAGYPAETIDEDERRAREQLKTLVAEGKAQEILGTWSFCKQSCDYVYGILRSIVHDGEADSGISDEIVNFARNLLDDWAK